MLRTLQIVASASFVALIIALVLLCVRSYWWRDLVWARVPNFGSASAVSLDGKLRCTVLWESTESANARFAWGYSRMSAPEAARALSLAHVQHRWSGLGLELVNFPSPFAVAVPDWFLAPPVALLAYWMFHPHKLRFSLRALLIAATLIAVALGLGVWLTS